MSKLAARRAARFGFNVAGTGGENLQQFFDDALVAEGKWLEEAFRLELTCLGDWANAQVIDSSFYQISRPRAVGCQNP